MCYAAQLYHDIPVKYYLLNNFSAPYDPVEAGITSYFEPLQKASEEGLAKVLKDFKELDHHDQTEFKCMSNYGPVHATIETIENSEDEDHIVVMGTRGATGMAELFLGTTTVGIIQNIKSPVIAVPYNAVLKSPSEIMLAIDQQGVDNLGELRPMIELAEKHSSTVSIVNIHQPEKALTLEKDSPEEFVIDHYLDDIEHNYYSIDGDYTEDKIMQFAHGMEIDLISIIHRERTFWQRLFHDSLTKRLAYHTDVPLLVLQG